MDPESGRKQQISIRTRKVLENCLEDLPIRPSSSRLDCHPSSKAIWCSYRYILRECCYLACESSSTGINAILDDFHMSAICESKGITASFTLHHRHAIPRLVSPPSVPAFTRDWGGDHDNCAAGQPQRGTIESIVRVFSSMFRRARGD